MAPPPKPAGLRQRRNKDTHQPTVMRFVPAPQPPLPDGVPWPDRTREWWAKWGESPQAELLMALDWEYLLDAALIHADVWGNFNIERIGELRTRVANFGVTLADRARLRVVFAEADQADAKREAAPAAARPKPRPRKDPLAVLHAV